MMTFDNADELIKIKRVVPHAKLVLRILTDDSRATVKLGVKFGAPPHSINSLIKLAYDMGLDLIGVSFHVGSGCFDANAFVEAVTAARRVFDEASKYGFELHLLDVGGGFPGVQSQSSIDFVSVARLLGAKVDELFPSSVRIIAEPGRYYVAAAYTLLVNVTARRVVKLAEDRTSKYMYYVNDGVYGSFNCIVFDHIDVHPIALTKAGTIIHSDEHLDVHECSIWGPTCDSMDCIKLSVALPLLEVGDWLCFENMGAYTMSAASTFNGFSKSNIIYTLD